MKVSKSLTFLTASDKKSYLLHIIQASATPHTTQKIESRSLVESDPNAPQAPLYSIPTAQSLIQEVKAIFPDYGEFFISCVLEVASSSVTATSCMD